MRSRKRMRRRVARRKVKSYSSPVMTGFQQSHELAERCSASAAAVSRVVLTTTTTPAATVALLVPTVGTTSSASSARSGTRRASPLERGGDLARLALPLGLTLSWHAARRRPGRWEAALAGEA